MLRWQERERDDAERPEKVRPSEPENAVARLLWLQRSAGNQAVARRLLQRVDVQGRIVHGEEAHHPRYEYKFPGDEQPRVYDYDPWFANKHTQSPTAYAAALTPQAIADVIKDWDAGQSIFTPINAAFVGTAAWGPKQGQVTGKHSSGQTQQGKITVKDQVAATAQGQLFAQHFLTLESRCRSASAATPREPAAARRRAFAPRNGTMTRFIDFAFGFGRHHTAPWALDQPIPLPKQIPTLRELTESPGADPT